MYRWLPVLLVLLFSANAFAAQRVVVLAPAAVDILEKLEAGEQIVGVTRSVEEFPHALRVGSHIRPNLEMIRSLEPDLLILSSHRFFSEAMAESVGAEVFHYQPETLEQILHQTMELATLLEKQKIGERLIDEQRKKLKQVIPLEKSPSVVFEVTAMPLMLAGKKSIVRDIIEMAGGKLLTTDERKLVRYNVEAILAQQPDVYIYQVGPMNRNPVPPQERGTLQRLNAAYLQVDELQYSRANTRSFDNVLELNNYFQKQSKR